MLVKKIAWMVSGFCWLGWTAAVFLQPTGATLKQALAATTARNSTWTETIKNPTPVTAAIESIWYKSFGTGIVQLRSLGVLATLIAGAAVYLAIYKKFSRENQWLAGMVIFTLPGLYILGHNHLPETLALAAWGGLLTFRGHQKWEGSMVLLMAGTSLTGLWGAIAWCIWQLKSQWKTYGFLLIVMAGFVYIQNEIGNEIRQTDLINNLRPTKLTEVINEQRKILHLATKESAPGWDKLSRLAINKATRGANLIINRAGETIDPTLWTAPLPAWVVTGLSGIPPKGIWPILFYWQILLLIGGLNMGMMGALAGGWLPIMMQQTALINSAAALAILPFCWAITNGVVKLSREKIWIKTGIAVLLLVGFIRFEKNYYSQYRDTQNGSVLGFETLWKIYLQLPKTNLIQVTDRFGDSKVMFDFYNNGVPENITFSGFDWHEKPPYPNLIYVGLTKEFGEDIKDGTILASNPLPDEIVYNYGKAIWAVKR